MDVPYSSDKPRIYFKDDYNKKFYGYEPGDDVVLKIDAKIISIGLESAEVEIQSCEIEGEASSFEEASRRAKNEIIVRTSIEQQAG